TSDLPNLKALQVPPPEMIPVTDWEVPLRVDQGPLALAVLRKSPYHHHQTVKEPGRNPRDLGMSVRFIAWGPG
ncbi:MAG: hypothetical protein ACXW2Q_09595, partial [Thermoanaerobaculia bacterium]